MTHNDLVRRAKKWLRGSLRCNPVFSGLASCSEIPDAIGWTSMWKYHGSAVVECKTSVTDFVRDKWKYIVWKHQENGWIRNLGWMKETEALGSGYVKTEVPRMGNFRFIMCEPGVITPEMLDNHAPDHGLLHVKGRSVSIVKAAPRREQADYPSEVRYLRFAIINDKIPFAGHQAERQIELSPQSGKESK